MPTSNTSSPVKRPGLGRRAVSSHAVVTRTPSNQGELSQSQSSNTTQKAPSRPHRPHLVGGGHRNHHRNPSFGKNLHKLQRHLSSHQIGPEASARVHQRKKSAPATPAASPRGHHVRWDGLEEESHRTEGSMKKNNSSPALRRDTSVVLGKKALVTDRPHTSSGKKKTVGFELADSDDDADWEDTTQSPESTRRSSVAQSKESVENPAVLVDPLTFVKRSYPQFARATSLPESTSKSFGEHHDSDEDEDNDNGDENPPKRPSDSDETPVEIVRPSENGVIASRILSPSISARAPPAMSSISATVKPTVMDQSSRNASLTNLASGHDGTRRPMSSSITTLANTPAHATSSSIEGGVSKFIISNKPATNSYSRTDSDPNTPSSFLPHYHPQTPPSPNRASSARKTRTSPPSRPPGAEPHSRTQQKLWLQRTAALNTSPPDGVSTVTPPSVVDPSFAAPHTRPGANAFEPGRGLVNGSARASGTAHDSEAKHVRKAYEKTTLELTVVRRFQSPTGDSFRRLTAILNDSRGASSSLDRPSSLGKPIKSAPALTHLRDSKRQESSQGSASPEPRQLIGRKQGDMHTSASQTYLQEPDDLVSESTDPTASGSKSQHPSHRILSTSDEPAHPDPATTERVPGADNLRHPHETELMMRRIWESREVATAG
ncbi:uncharacterized protein BO97DRAFT_129481 [Aspergillus homomorphus CBS 101889]|uniref:Uncharacterized protein n=1 Tax=Aspergillus homomorphus (strain CBS 101889) TaxID=1450537 RepID=A0A395I832_ASPHC|nr:hypothetical protein BO97DRAFT_129481 [Aspergillus homomorphus CBS 101889]RAL16277.1 hypothetical protein BO97DRAFT_129481 [Aspergillus homomorphus CBS 101889]